MKRVYHPTLNSWAYVPDMSVPAWTRKGWRASKPGHIVEPVTGGPAPKSATPKPTTSRAPRKPKPADKV